MTTLSRIREECLPEDEKNTKKETQGKVDPFVSAKGKISSRLKEIRTLIKERDEAEATNPGSVHSVELAQNVRMAIGSAQEDIDAMQKQFATRKARWEKKSAKLKARQSEKSDSPDRKVDPAEEQIQVREQVIGAISQHMDEIIQLEKKRYGAGPLSTVVVDPTVTELPDVDDPRFQQLIKTDQEVDTLLEIVLKNVTDLHEIAREQNVEARAQAQTLRSLEVDVDRADKKLVALNQRLKVILEKARPGSKFCIDFVLICVLLGLGGLVYNIVRSRW